MKKFIIHKDSWHYRWFRFYTYMKDYKIDADYYDNFNSSKYENSEEYMDYVFVPRDFCSYWRNVLVWPAIRLGLNITAYVFLISMIYTFGLIGFAGNITIVIGTVGLVLAIGGCIALVKYISSKTTNAISNEDTFFSNIKQSYKDKFCAVVEYKKEEK